MRKIVLSLAFLLFGSVCALSTDGDNTSSTPQSPVVRKIKVRHADPLFILYMLQGKNPPYPEISLYRRW